MEKLMEKPNPIETDVDSVRGQSVKVYEKVRGLKVRTLSF